MESASYSICAFVVLASEIRNSASKCQFSPAGQSLIQSCKHRFAILSSGRFCKWIQNFKILISMVKFKNNLLNSFLAATLGIVCLLLMTVYKGKYAFFSIISFSQWVKSSLSEIPHSSEPQRRMSRKSELKSLFVISGGIFRSLDNDKQQRRIRRIALPYLLNLIYKL